MRSSLLGLAACRRGICASMWPVVLGRCCREWSLLGLCAHALKIVQTPLSPLSVAVVVRIVLPPLHLQSRWFMCPLAAVFRPTRTSFTSSSFQVLSARDYPWISSQYTRADALVSCAFLKKTWSIRLIPCAFLMNSKFKNSPTFVATSLASFCSRTA